MKFYYPIDKDGNQIGFKTPESQVYDKNGVNLTNKLTSINENINNLNSEMVAATESSDGKSGLVPAPSAGSSNRYLKSDGTWGTPSDTTYNVATETSDGLESADDKKKLNSINFGAEVNQNAFANIVVGATTIEADSKTDTLTLEGNNVTLTPDTSNDKVTIGITKQNVTDALGYTPPTTNTTYSPATLGQGRGTCSTAESTTAKVVSLSNYALVTGGIVVVKFTYAVPASSTLNVNSKGAKSIYFNGSAIAAGIIKAGDTVTFIYDGSYYHVIAIDSIITKTLKLSSFNSSTGTLYIVS